MKEKKYYSQFAYFIKIILIIALLAVAFYFFAELSYKIAKELSIFFRRDFIVMEYSLNTLAGIILGAAVLLVGVRGKPQITINATTLRTNRFKRDFSELKSYHTGRGGSEPYVISHDGKQLDIELSWFSKRDRKEIEAFIIQQIETANL